MAEQPPKNKTPEERDALRQRLNQMIGNPGDDPGGPASPAPSHQVHNDPLPPDPPASQIKRDRDAFKQGVDQQIRSGDVPPDTPDY